jgi:hypothetical protein
MKSTPIRTSEEKMNKTTRGGAVAAILLGSLWAAGALAQNAGAGRNLTIEAAPHHRPAHRPHRPAYAVAPRPVQASLMPIGPSTLPVGAPLQFKMVSLADGYGALYVLSASGRAQVWLENVRLRAGAPLTYPNPGLIVRAAAPAGDDVVLFVASRRPISGFLGGGGSDQPFDLQSTHEGFRSALQSQLNSLARTDWALAEVTVRVTE